jgi:hypothetical protein
MTAPDREWLMSHLHEQIAHLSALARSTDGSEDDRASLLALRDQIFVIRETLDTLGVPHARASNTDWNRAIGTTPS